MDLGLVVGVVVIGIVHGVLPDHGWPIAATYALGRPRRYLAGTVAGVILGVGHLVSSVALVAAYYWFSGFAAFAEGPWLRYVAGTALILLGIREYRHGGDHGHAHGDHGHGHHEHARGDRNDGVAHGDHAHGDQGNGHIHGDREDGPGESGHDRTDGGYRGHDGDGLHDHDGDGLHDHDGDGLHDHDGDGLHGHDSDGLHGHDGDAHSGRNRTAGGILSGLRSRLPGSGHRHLDESDAERGLVALGTTALVLGFAHEEPIQILAICVGTAFCLELMLVYSLAVIVAILLPTLGLIAGYEHHRETVEAYTPYLPLLTAVVLVGMGLAFILGVF